MAQCNDALATGAMSPFDQQWADLIKWQAIHAAMEDGVPGTCAGFFKVLNEKCDGAATSLQALHPALDVAEAQVNEAIAAGELAAVTAKYHEFATLNLAHLEAEEKVMMPKVQALTKAGENMKAIMIESLLPAVPAADFAFFISFALSTLEAYQARVGDGTPKLRVFAHALKAVANQAQWADWRPVAAAAISPEALSRLEAEIDF